MRKILTLVATSVLLISNLQAQKRATQFSIAAEAAVMATKQAYKVYNLGFGGSGKILMPTGKKNYFTGTVGVIAFSGRSGTLADVLQVSGAPTNINVAHPSLTIITPKFGYKYFIKPKLNTEIEVGYTFASVKKLSTDITGEIGGPAFSIGMGFLVTRKLDIGLRYEQFVTTASEKDYTSFVGLRTLLMLDFK